MILSPAVGAGPRVTGRASGEAVAIREEADTPGGKCKDSGVGVVVTALWAILRDEGG